MILKGPKLNVLIRDKILFVGIAHLTRASRSCSWALYHSHKWRHSRTYMTSTTRRHYSITLSLPRCGHILRLPLRNPTAIVRSRRFSSRPISSCLNRYRKKIFLCLWHSSTLSSRYYLKRSRHAAFPRLSRPSSLHSTKFNKFASSSMTRATLARNTAAED